MYLNIASYLYEKQIKSEVWEKEQKEEIWLSLMIKAPTPTEKSIKQRDKTKTMTLKQCSWTEI